jgi:rRNA-processing protein FCF1
MDKPRFMLDASVIIGCLNNKLDLFGFLAAQGECEVFFNLVSEIDAAAIETAIQIRRAKELLLPDALIAATAITLNATVLSNDPHLRDYRHPGYTAQSVL